MKLILTVVSIMLVLPAFAEQKDKEYRPGGAKWAKVWQEFYNNPGCEADLMNPIVQAGKGITPTLIEATAHKDMKFRRYAIGALGWLKDRRAIPYLEKILKDNTEVGWIRGDALESIFLIDPKRGRRYAKEYKETDGFLKEIGEAIERNEKWLTTYPEC